jgi:hypothetical protein
MADLCLGYLDPGSGSLLLQLIVGSVVGMSLFFRQYLSRVLRMFRRTSA